VKEIRVFSQFISFRIKLATNNILFQHILNLDLGFRQSYISVYLVLSCEGEKK